MFKIQSIFLLIFLTNISTEINACDGPGGHGGTGSGGLPILPTRSLDELARSLFAIHNAPLITGRGKATNEVVNLQDKLEHNVFRGNIDKVREAIEQRADVNKKRGDNSVIHTAIERAKFSLGKNLPDANTRLEIIELLIQNGAKINEPVGWGWTALESALTSNIPRLPIIKLLLGYGANITKKASDLASEKLNKEEIVRIFDLHQKLIKQVKSNPTKELLRLMIYYNKPYIVQLIVDKKPELVALSDVKFARAKSLGSVPILSKAMRIPQLWEIASQKGIPIELTHHIEKFVERNK